MIRKLVLFGWLALISLLVAGATGYAVESGSDRIPNHLLAALVAFGTLGLVFLCTTSYLIGMGRLVRDVTRSSGLEPDREARHRRLVRRGAAWSLAALILLVAAAFSGYPTHVGAWEPIVHHVVFWLSILVTVAALWRLGPLVREEEGLVRSVDEELERAASRG